MELGYMQTLPTGGFNYDNCIRNKALAEHTKLSAKELSHVKTGTTICGIIFKVSTPSTTYIQACLLSTLNQ